MEQKISERLIRSLVLSLFIAFAVHSTGQSVTAGNVANPSDFLGYALGDRFTPHHRVVDYVTYLAEAVPFIEKMEYGRTTEGRPLQLLVVSHPDNMEKIDAFRSEHLDRVAGGPGTEEWDDVAVAWLSYNVHGNEAVCTEAALEVMHRTIVAAQQGEDWLKQLFIIIDPCLNPDGHDRYTNWFAQYASSTPNADPAAFEHDEPWPGGRPNHYLFDLNRDWAWQKQIESQARSKVYHDWMPHVHCDYHEMGYNSPYYFAPAAEPYHEIITDWQREFQEEIGEATSKNFDDRGELYYTRESFDLLYPSYGDTYPIYNGAIGMTYEQGGSGGAGVLVEQSSGDSLSLKQRIENHVMSSLEALFTSARLSQQLVEQMAEFFEQNRTNPAGKFKAYCIPVNPSNLKRTEQLVEFLQKHHIKCERIVNKERIAQAWEYGTKTSRSLITKAGDLVINAHQTHSGMLNVLFDPDPALSDSLTYDITTWSVPYAYGLQTFGLDKPVMGQPWEVYSESSAVASGSIEPSFGWAIHRNGIADSRFVARAMAQGIRIRTNAEPIMFADLKLERGSAIILASDQHQHDLGSLVSTLQKLSDSCDAKVSSLSAGHPQLGPDMGSDDVWLLHPPRVACLSGEGVSSLGAGESWWHFEQELKYPITMLNTRNSNPSDWHDFDVLIIPSGWYGSTDDDWLAELRNWIRQGGRAIAISSALNMFVDEEGWGLERYDDGEQAQQVSNRRALESSKDRYQSFSQRNRSRAMRTGDGSIYAVNLDQSHPLAWGYPDAPYYTMRSTSSRYAALEDGWNMGVYGFEPEAISGFVGHRANQELSGSLTFGVKPMGQGSITYMVDNPLFRGFWENGKLLFDNAVFFNQY